MTKNLTIAKRLED